MKRAEKMKRKRKQNKCRNREREKERKIMKLGELRERLRQ
jgi:hypothetical protein